MPLRHPPAPKPRDYTAEVEHHRRTEMERASARLLAALRDQHPRIMAHLERNRSK